MRWSGASQPPAKRTKGSEQSDSAGRHLPARRTKSRPQGGATSRLRLDAPRTRDIPSMPKTSIDAATLGDRIGGRRIATKKGKPRVTQRFRDAFAPALPCPLMSQRQRDQRDSTRIRLAFSPDSDDGFMFWPLLTGKVDQEGFQFEAERADTETLNELAARGEFDVVAVSIARWPAIAEQYLLLPHGMSVGRGYGPVLIAARARELASLEGARIGVPGLSTTAHLVLRLLIPNCLPVVVPTTPQARAFDALRAGEIDAVVLIHEGRLTFEREGFNLVCDLGEAWSRISGGLPLPLGANAIKRALGGAKVASISRILRSSIAWSLANRQETISALLDGEPGAGIELDRSMVDTYLGLYANSDTLEAPDDVRRAIGILYARAHEAGLIHQAPQVDFAP
jgi:1,4-dihydroxy-6-naphthoate synthase